MPPRSSQGGARSPIKSAAPSSAKGSANSSANNSSKKKPVPNKKKTKQVEEEESLRLQQEQREQEGRQAQFDAYIAEEQNRRVEEFDQDISYNHIPTHDVSLFQNIFTRTFADTLSKPIVPPPPVLPPIIPETEPAAPVLPDPKAGKPRSGAGKARRVATGKGDTGAKADSGKTDGHKNPDSASSNSSANSNTNAGKLGNTSTLSKHATGASPSSLAHANAASAASPTSAPPNQTKIDKVPAYTLPGTLLPRQSLPPATLNALSELERQYKHNEDSVNAFYSAVAPSLSINSHLTRSRKEARPNFGTGDSPTAPNSASASTDDLDVTASDERGISGTGSSLEVKDSHDSRGIAEGMDESLLQATTSLKATMADIDQEYHKAMQQIINRNRATHSRLIPQNTLYPGYMQPTGSSSTQRLDAAEQDLSLAKTRASLGKTTDRGEAVSASEMAISSVRPGAQIPLERKHLQYALQMMRFSNARTRTRNGKKGISGKTVDSGADDAVISRETEDLLSSMINVNPPFLNFYPAPENPSHKLTITVTNNDVVSHRVALLPSTKPYISATLQMKSGQVHIDGVSEKLKKQRDQRACDDAVPEQNTLREGEKYSATNTKMTTYTNNTTVALPGTTVSTNGGSLAPGMSAMIIVVCNYDLTSTLHTSFTIRTDIGNFEVPIFIRPPVPNLGGIPTIWKIPAASPNAVSESVLYINDTNAERERPSYADDTLDDDRLQRTDAQSTMSRNKKIPKEFYVIPAYKVLSEGHLRQAEGREVSKSSSGLNDDGLEATARCFKLVKGDVKTGLHDPLYAAESDTDDHDDNFYKISSQFDDKSDEEISLFMNNPSLCLLATQFGVDTILDVYHGASKRHYFDNGEYNIQDFNKYVASLIKETQEDQSKPQTSMHCVSVPVTAPEILITGTLDDNRVDKNDNQSTSASYVPAHSPDQEPDSYALTLSPTVFTVDENAPEARDNGNKYGQSRTAGVIKLTSQFASTVPLSMQSLFVLFSNSGNFMIFSVSGHCTQPMLSLLQVNNTIFNTPVREITASSSESSGKQEFPPEESQARGIPLPLLHANELPSFIDAVTIDDIPAINLPQKLSVAVFPSSPSAASVDSSKSVAEPAKTATSPSNASDKSVTFKKTAKKTANMERNNTTTNNEPLSSPTSPQSKSKTDKSNTTEPGKPDAMGKTLKSGRTPSPPPMSPSLAPTSTTLPSLDTATDSLSSGSGPASPLSPSALAYVNHVLHNDSQNSIYNSQAAHNFATIPEKSLYETMMEVKTKASGLVNNTSIPFKLALDPACYALPLSYSTKKTGNTRSSDVNSVAHDRHCHTVSTATLTLRNDSAVDVTLKAEVSQIPASSTTTATTGEGSEESGNCYFSIFPALVTLPAYESITLTVTFKPELPPTKHFSESTLSDKGFYNALEHQYTSLVTFSVCNLPKTRYEYLVGNSANNSESAQDILTRPGGQYVLVNDDDGFMPLHPSAKQKPIDSENSSGNTPNPVFFRMLVSGTASLSPPTLATTSASSAASSTSFLVLTPPPTLVSQPIESSFTVQNPSTVAYNMHLAPLQKVLRSPLPPALASMVTRDLYYTCKPDTTATQSCACVPTWADIMSLTLTPTSLSLFSAAAPAPLTLPPLALTSADDAPALSVPPRSVLALTVSLVSTLPLALTPGLLTLPLTLSPVSSLESSLDAALSTCLSLAFAADITAPALTLPFSSSNISPLIIFPKPDNSLTLIPETVPQSKVNSLENSEFPIPNSLLLPCGWTLQPNATLTKTITLHNPHSCATQFHIYPCVPSLARNSELNQDFSSPLSTSPESGEIAPHEKVDIQITLSYADVLTIKMQEHTHFLALSSGMGTLPVVSKISVAFNVMNIDIYPKKITYGIAPVKPPTQNKKQTSLSLTTLSVGGKTMHDITFHIPDRVASFYTSCRRDVVVNVEITNVPATNAGLIDTDTENSLSPSPSSTLSSPSIQHVNNMYIFTNDVITVTMPSPLTLNALTQTPPILSVKGHSPGAFACLVMFHLEKSSLTIPMMIQGIVSPLQWNVGIISPSIIQKLSYFSPLYKILTYLKHHINDPLIEELSNMTSSTKISSLTHQYHTARTPTGTTSKSSSSLATTTSANAVNGKSGQGSDMTALQRARRSSMVVVEKKTVDLREGGEDLHSHQGHEGSRMHRAERLNNENIGETAAKTTFTSLFSNTPLTHGEIRDMLKSEFSNSGKSKTGNSRREFSQLSDCFRWNCAWGPQNEDPSSEFTQYSLIPTPFPPTCPATPHLAMSSSAGSVSLACVVLRNDSDAHIDVRVEVEYEGQDAYHNNSADLLGASSGNVPSLTHTTTINPHATHTTALYATAALNATNVNATNATDSHAALAPRLKLPDLFRKPSGANDKSKTSTSKTSPSKTSTSVSTATAATASLGKTKAKTSSCVPAMLPPLRGQSTQTAGDHQTAGDQSSLQTGGAELKVAGEENPMYVNGRYYMDGKGYQSSAGQQFVQMDMLRRQKQLLQRTITIWPHVTVIPSEVYSLWTKLSHNDDINSKPMSDHFMEDLSMSDDNIPLADALLALQRQQPIITVPARSIICVRLYSYGSNQGHYNAKLRITYQPTNDLSVIDPALSARTKTQTLHTIRHVPLEIPVSVSVTGSPVIALPGGQMRKNQISEKLANSGGSSKSQDLGSEFRTGIGHISLASHMSQLSNPMHTYATTQHLPTLLPTTPRTAYNTYAHPTQYPYSLSAPPNTHAFMAHTHSLALAPSLHPFHHLLSSKSSAQPSKLSKSFDTMTSSAMEKISLLQSVLSIQTHAFNVLRTHTGPKPDVTGVINALTHKFSDNRAAAPNSSGKHGTLSLQEKKLQITSPYALQTTSNRSVMTLAASLLPLDAHLWLQFVKSVHVLMQHCALTQERPYDDNITQNRTDSETDYDNYDFISGSNMTHVMTSSSASCQSVQRLLPLLPLWAFTPYYLPVSGLVRQQRQSVQTTPMTPTSGQGTMRSAQGNELCVQSRLRLFNKSSKHQQVTLDTLAMKTVHPEEVVKTVVTVSGDNDDVVVNVSFTPIDIIAHMKTLTSASHYDQIITIIPPVLSISPGQAAFATLTINADRGYASEIGAMMITSEIDGVVSCNCVVIWDEQQEEDQWNM